MKNNLPVTATAAKIFGVLRIRLIRERPVFLYRPIFIDTLNEDYFQKRILLILPPSADPVFS